MYVCRDLQPRMHVELLHEIANVRPNGEEGNAQFLRDFLRAHALCNEVHHLALATGQTGGQQTKLAVLHIGSSGTFTGATKSDKEKGALDTLKAFIKEETGLNNEIIQQKDWRDLADNSFALWLGILYG